MNDTEHKSARAHQWHLTKPVQRYLDALDRARAAFSSYRGEGK